MPATYRDEVPAPFVADQPVVKETVKGGLTMERARRIASNFSRGSLRAVQIVDTDSGQAIVAVNSHPQGKSNFVILEKRGAKYRVSSQGKLDIEGFRRAAWTSEVVDADEDGYQGSDLHRQRLPESLQASRSTSSPTRNELTQCSSPVKSQLAAHHA